LKVSFMMAAEDGEGRVVQVGTAKGSFGRWAAGFPTGMSMDGPRGYCLVAGCRQQVGVRRLLAGVGGGWEADGKGWRREKRVQLEARTDIWRQ
jgi:hypothetical protein